MRRIAVLAIMLTLLATVASSQATKIATSGTLPTSCTVGNVYVKTGTSPGVYACLAANTWTGPLTAGGSGTVTTTGSPASGNLAAFSGATSITNGDLSGDLTTSGTLATTLATSGVSAGTYGSSTKSAVVTFDAKGRATAASEATIIGGGGGTGVVLLDSVGQLDIVNTTTETALYSFSVPANTLTTSSIRLRLVGDQLNNAGAGSDVVTLRIKYGATSMFSDTATYVNNATRTSWAFDVTLGNASGSTDQFVMATFLLSQRGGAAVGNGDWNNNGLNFIVLSGTAAENSATTLTFQITIEHSIANANTSWRRKYASLTWE